MYGDGAIAWKTEQARLKVWASPIREELVQYLDALRNCYQTEGSWQQIPYRYYLQAVSHRHQGWWEQNQPDLRPVHAEWLIYGGCERRIEMQMMHRLVSAMLATGTTTAYLVRFGSQEHEQIRSLAQQYPAQMTLIDLYHGLGSERRRLSAAAVHSAWRHFQILNEIVGKDLQISERTFSFFLGAMAKKLLWQRLKPFLHYNRLLVRNHFGSLDSVLALDALNEGKPVVTLQHGVISSSGFFPVLATTVLTFGRSSADFMAREDRRFAQRCGTPVYAREYIPVGSLFDEIRPVPDGFHHRTVLVIDQYNASAERFYGLNNAYRRLPQAVMRLLHRVPSARVRLRLHPSQRELGYWAEIAGGQMEVSKDVALHDDLAHATIAVGLFSGALTIAAVSGVASFFVWEPGWFYTPDLACFNNTCFVDVESFVDVAAVCLTSAEEYHLQREKVLQSAGDYYHERRGCNFAEVAAILRDKVVTPRD